MRHIAWSVLLIATLAAPASGQVRPRVDAGPVVRQDRLSFEGSAEGTSQVTGIAVSVAITKQFGVAGEFTSARHDTSRSYEGYFMSYADPPSSRDEFERLGVYARRTDTYAPRLGGSAAFTIRGDPDARIDTVLKLGVSFRQYVESSDITILRVPDGIDPSRPAAFLSGEPRDRTRSGVFIGFAVPVAVTRRLIVSPELRYVWGGPARIGSKYREFGLGASASWRF